MDSNDVSRNVLAELSGLSTESSIDEHVKKIIFGNGDDNDVDEQISTALRIHDNMFY